MSEPPLDLRAHIGRTIRATLVTTFVLAATMMLMTLVVGAWLVGRPITGLIGQAQRVAAGDLGARSAVRQRDELGDLTRELNKMLDRLESAGAEVQASTRKRLETLEQLRHAERLTTIGRLASSVAHELGTPLNVMTGRARLIVEDEKLAAVHARVIIDQGERMTKIIRQLLDYARRRPAQRVEEDLCRVAADAVALLAPLATKKKMKTALQPGGRGSPGHRGRHASATGLDQPDRERDSGQRRGRDDRGDAASNGRRVRAGRARPWAGNAARRAGPRIRAFLHHQADRRIDRARPVRHARHHRRARWSDPGRERARSRQPILDVIAPEVGVTDETRSGARVARVLAIDDEPEMGALLELGLSKRGFQTVSRTSGDDALALLDQADFDAIVVDLNMPGTSGLDVASWVAANRPDTPVVVVTAFGSLETAVAAIRAGAYDFVTKPFEIEAIALTLERAVSHRRLRAEVRRLRLAAGDTRDLSPTMRDFPGRRF